MPRVIFKRGNICREFDIGKDVFYLIASLPRSPLKLLRRPGSRTGVWACNVEEMAAFISTWGGVSEETKPYSKKDERRK